VCLYASIPEVIEKLQLALGSWVPPTSEKGLWFYSGLAAVLLGSLLITPFYTKPVDAISYSVAALVALLAVYPSIAPITFERALWLATALFIVAIIIFGILSIALKDSPISYRQKISKSLYLLSDRLGSPIYVFSAVFLFSLIAFHRNNPRQYLVIALAWAVLIGLRPLEMIMNVFSGFWNIWNPGKISAPCGEVVSHEIPGVVLVRQKQGTQLSFGDTLVVRGDDGCPSLALALDHVGYAGGLWLRALHLGISPNSRECLQGLGGNQDPSGGVAFLANVEDLGIDQIPDKAWRNRDSLVGLVAPETDISRLRIEITRTDIDLEEGRLIEVEIGSRNVLYQLVNGLTREEILEEKNKRGYVRADAKKIGSWNEHLGRFDLVKWVPRLNAPVFLVDTVPTMTERQAVGHFPGTDYPVSMDMNALATHNGAVLGILGVGKTYLALELIERMIKEGIKVISFDLTNQYSQELKPYYCQSVEDRIIQLLRDIGPQGKNSVQQNVEEGGSVKAFKEKVYKILKRFLHPKTTVSLAIFNPAEFEVWRQDSRPYQNRASMATLTPTEVTRIFTEVTLQVLQEQGMTDKARCCLVFEEAHSLIPEWTAVASEGDKTATNGTAKAILQGRKYGLGCLVITQRTANVTKSILNQCNTIFALRVFDATGMEFLKNYIGEDYTGVLSMLEDRHAVVFGRASSCRDPVLIRLNDRSNFLGVFRNGEIS